jgi:hypothetical protein
MPTCPKGHTSVATDYCDECGAPMEANAAPAPVVAETPPPEACPECSSPRDGRFCEVCGHDFLSVTGPSTVEPAPAAAAVIGRVVVTADRAYYDRMRATAGEDAEDVPFPAFCPERRFALDGGQVLIGRRSRSRGIEPAIDLTGPPEDAGVSHSHALLVADADGAWSVVDLDSANGTYLNDSTDPLPANQPAKLAVGDRVHLGAWTTLTVTA